MASYIIPTNNPIIEGMPIPIYEFIRLIHPKTIMPLTPYGQIVDKSVLKGYTK
jgi:hypothetical protein